MVKQHNKILFLKQTTKKIRRFVKISCILISLFYVTKSLFFFSTPLSKNQCIDSLQWLISYQISFVVIARQPKYCRFYALITSLHDIDITIIVYFAHCFILSGFPFCPGRKPIWWNYYLANSTYSGDIYAEYGKYAECAKYANLT